MGKKKKGRSAKKNVPQAGGEEPQEVLQAPHSFVIHRGLPCPKLSDLTRDFRKIMEPFTAMNLKERKSNKIKDFVSLSGPVGVSKSIKKLITGKIPNMARCEDIADFIEKANGVSDSEFEDDEANHVVLPQDLPSRGNIQNQKSAIKLHELGPRMTIQLMKIEAGLFNGEVLFHELVVKTEEEKDAIRRKIEKRE
uniref:Brix domain-containing protein n=1 Tax=Lutzomyia longipalpis TaxID=7200 RepID=A0A1B0GIQ9_LUTLO